MLEPVGGEMKREMTESDVIELLEECNRLQIPIWLDGGWAVDALLGEQTRRHQDLDIVVERNNVEILVDVLQQKGFRESPRDDSEPWNFVLGDEAGREVDFHVIEFDHSGNGLYGPLERGERYEAAALQGSGMIQGRPVRCIAADWLLAYHTGYETDEQDWKDVAALCDKFGLPIPSEYSHFTKHS